MKEIISNTNKNYKLCMQLAMKKYRDRYGLYLVEGEHLIAEAIKRGIRIKDIFIRDDYPYNFGDSYPAPYVLNKKLFGQLALTLTSQGIIAVAEKRSYGKDDFLKLRGDDNLLVLDRLQDPGNIGTMIRTADAAGYGGVLVIKGSCDVFSPKAARAAAGSLFSLPVFFAETASEALDMLREIGKRTVGACPNSETSCYDADMKRGIALMIGNEGGGLSRELTESADVRVKIPMKRGVDSLNAAVAAGILMYCSPN